MARTTVSTVAAPPSRVKRLVGSNRLATPSPSCGVKGRSFIGLITAKSDGTVINKEEDRSGDGKRDLKAWFEKGKLTRLEQDTQGDGCTDLKQWFDGNEKVRAEYRDTTGNCKTDVWSYFEKSVLTRQG